MWPFTKDKQYHEVITPLRKCCCGNMSYGPLRGDDAVYCNYCGAIYLIYYVNNPVAKKELVERKDT